MNDYFEKILQAEVYEVAKKTPLEKAHNLSIRLNNEVFLKREDLQDVVQELETDVHGTGELCGFKGRHPLGKTDHQ